MHGILILELERFIKERSGEEGWWETCRRAGATPRQFNSAQPWSDAQFHDLVGGAATVLGSSVAVLEEGFGRFLAPNLIRFGLFQGVVRPEWGALEIIRRVQSTIHSTLVLQNGELLPPVIQVEVATHNTLRLRYRSPRRLCRMLQGIVVGLGDFFAEPLTIIESHCQLTGSEACEFTVVAGRGTFFHAEELADQEEILTKLAAINRENLPLQARLIRAGVHFLVSLVPLAVRQERLVVRPQREFLPLCGLRQALHLESPLFTAGVRCRIEAVDPEESTVTCAGFQFDEGVWERGDLRVEPDHPVSVTLTGAEEEPIPGWLVDISTRGANCGIALEDLLGRRIGRHVVLDFTLPLAAAEGGRVSNRLHLSGDVEKVRILDGQCVLVVRCHPSGTESEKLTRYIERRRLQVRPSP